jgi:NADH/NAD ratio-sensing transcriptional regulator Rex
LELVDVERIPIHGGTLRLFVSNKGESQPSDAVAEMLKIEAEIGMDKFDYYNGFAQRVEGLKISLRDTLTELISQGKTIAGYGAAAKGAVLLNYFELGSEQISYVVDRNPAKQDRFMPGVQIPISDPSRILKQMPDYLLLFAWNFADEIMAQQAEYVARGGKFIIPVPEVKIV